VKQVAVRGVDLRDLETGGLGSMGGLHKISDDLIDFGDGQ